MSDSQPESGSALKQLDARDFQLAEQVRNVYRVEIDEGITRPDMLNPAFWAHISAKLRPYDEISIIRRDGTLYARAVVLNAERTWARVAILDWHDLTIRDVSLSQKAPKSDPAPTPADPASDFSFKHKGTRLKWCVIRNADGAHVREGEESKLTAMTWLESYLKVTT